LIHTEDNSSSYFLGPVGISDPREFIEAELLIHTEDNSSSYFLGPVGISDPREFIEAESSRIPFNAALSGPQLWQDAFKN
jgi:hypothetical protein